MARRKLKMPYQREERLSDAMKVLKVQQGLLTQQVEDECSATQAAFDVRLEELGQ